MRTNDRSGIELTTRSPSRNASPGKVRHILIFDDHPESLRLVSQYQPNWDIKRPRPRPPQWRRVLGLLLILFLIAAIFWPLLTTKLVTIKGDLNMFPGTVAQVRSVAPGAR
jgi:hypothetical protein